MNKDDQALLLKEWDVCEASISRFDTLHFQIRSWAASAISVLAAAGFTLAEPSLLVIGAFATFTFWVTEALHKTYQDVFIARSRHVQQALRGDMTKFFPAKLSEDRSFPCVSRQFKDRHSEKRLKRLRRLAKSFYQPVVSTPYVMMVILSAGGALWLVEHPRDPRKETYVVVRVPAGITTHIKPEQLRRVPMATPNSKTQCSRRRLR